MKSAEHKERKKMRTLKMALLGLLFVAGQGLAATNYFTGAVDNQTQKTGNWSLGVITAWDDAVVADWSLGAVRTSGTGWANMYYKTLTFNADMNAVSGTQFTFNNVAGVTNFVRDSITVDAGVTNNIRLGGIWMSDDTDLNIHHNGSAKLETDAGLYQSTLNVNYFGNNKNKLEFEGGSANSKYAGTTVLDNVSADVLVSGTATKGPFGIGSNAVVLQNGAELNFTTTTILNTIEVHSGENASLSTGIKAHTFDMKIDGQLDISGTGAYWFNGKLSGAGDVTVAGGTVVFNRAAGDSDISGTMAFNGITQARADSQFGTATIILKDTANFRGFNDQIGETIHILNEIEVNPNNPSAIPRIASTGVANSTPHTVVSNITFTADGNLSLQATANSTTVGDASFVDVTGVISDGANTGNIVIDNEWGGISFANGIVRLYGANTYKGTTTIEDGRVQLVDGGSIDSSAQLIVSSIGIFDVSTRTGGSYTYGGAVSGTGLMVGDLVLTGALNPGNSPGTLSFDGALTLSAGSTTTMEITDSAYDVLMGNGIDVLTMNGETVFDFTGFSGGVTNGYSIALTDLFNNWGSYDLSGATYSAAGLSGGQSLDFTGGNLTVVPEPATLGLIGMCSVLVLVVRRFMMI